MEPRHMGPRKGQPEKPLPPGDRALIQQHEADVLDLDRRDFSPMMIAAKLRVPHRIVHAILEKRK